MAGPLGRLVLLLSLVFNSFLLALGRPSTGIIDDSDSDDTSNLQPGYKIAFLPAKNGHWNDQSACTNPQFCLSQIDASQCRDSTWTATALFSSNGRSIEIDFIGDRVSVFFTLVGAGPSTFSTRCTFTLDGGSPVAFDHTPTTAGPGSMTFSYQSNVYNSSGLLTHGPHKLVIAIAGGSYVNFDFAQYGFDDEAPLVSSSSLVRTVTTTFTAQPTSTGDSSTSNSSTTTTSNGSSDGVFKAAIIGGSISGTIVVVAVVFFLIYRSRLRKKQAQGDALTFGVPSTYAGSTRKLSLPFWPNGHPGDNSSQLRNLTPLPEKRASYGSGYYSEKYDDGYTVASPPPVRGQVRDRSSTVSHGPMLSPANALMQSFYPNGGDHDRDRDNKRGSHTTGKLSRLEDNLSPVSNFPRHLSRFSEVRERERERQATEGGEVTISSSNVLPLSPDSSAGRPAQGSYYAV